MSWFDDGTRVRVYVSTYGDYVSLGDRTDYPFTTPSAGVPQGWTFWAQTGSQSDVYMSVANGRWSIQNVSSTNANNGGKYFITRDIGVLPTSRDYIIRVQSQVMQGKSPANRQVSYAPNNVGMVGTNVVAQDSWEQVALLPVANTDTTFFRVYLGANPYWANSADAKTDWAIQYQNFAIISMPKNPDKPTWEEITCDVKQCVTRYGRARFTERYDVASAQIILRNDDGEFTYDPFPDTAAFRPGRFIRVTVTPPGSSTEYPHYYGLIDSVADSYGLDGRATVELQCVDTTSLLSNTNVPTVTDPATVLNSGSRIYYLARAARYNMNTVYVDNGVFDQQGITANGRSIREEMGVSADSEGGYLYCDRLGNLQYKNRDAATTIASWKTVQGELLAECAPWIYHNKLSFPGGTDPNYGSIATATAFDFTNQYDIQARVTLNDVMGPTQTIVSRGNFWWLRKAAGVKRLEGKLSGTNVVNDADIPYDNGQTFWVRVRRGSGFLTFYTAPDSDAPPGAWNQLGSQTVLGISMTPSTNPISIGGMTTGDPFTLNGDVRRVLIYGQSLTNIVDVNPLATMDGYEGQTVVPISVGQPNMAISQSGGWHVVTPDERYPSTELITVDTVPTIASPPVVLLKALGSDWSRDRIINELKLANQGGTAFAWVNDPSQTRYGPRTYQRLDFVNVNNKPEYLTTRANDYMIGYSDAILRVNSVDFIPRQGTYEFIMKLFLNDLVRVRYTNRLNGWGFSVVSHVQQIACSIDTDGWGVQLLLDNPVAFNAWDQAQEGAGWDSADWDESKWDGALQAFWSRDAAWSDGISTWG